jgi:hypothetical protein
MRTLKSLVWGRQSQVHSSSKIDGLGRILASMVRGHRPARFAELNTHHVLGPGARGWGAVMRTMRQPLRHTSLGPRRRAAGCIEPPHPTDQREPWHRARQTLRPQPTALHHRRAAVGSTHERRDQGAAVGQAACEGKEQRPSSNATSPLSTRDRQRRRPASTRKRSSMAAP